MFNAIRQCLENEKRIAAEKKAAADAIIQVQKEAELAELKRIMEEKKRKEA